MTRISDYDTYDYDYSDYWADRSYEDKAERHSIVTLLNQVDAKGRAFLDLGGSFGRLTDVYAKRYDYAIIADYSLQTLQKYRDEIVKQNPNTVLIAANVYKQPFKDGVIDGGVMIRVAHHLENIPEAMTETQRVLSPGAFFIQEYANKNHIKAVIRAVFKMNFSFFKAEPYQQPSTGSLEGSKEESIFLNFPPKYMDKVVREANLDQVNYRGTSFLRIPRLKRYLSPEVMMSIEKFLQGLPLVGLLSPSVHLLLNKKGERSGTEYKEFEELLCCPSCNSDLTFSKDSAHCPVCNCDYNKRKGVWDFRVQ